jgi:hypothetical protein
MASARAADFPRLCVSAGYPLKQERQAQLSHFDNRIDTRLLRHLQDDAGGLKLPESFGCHG